MALDGATYDYRKAVAIVFWLVDTSRDVRRRYINFVTLLYNSLVPKQPITIPFHVNLVLCLKPKSFHLP